VTEWRHTCGCSPRKPCPVAKRLFEAGKIEQVRSHLARTLEPRGGRKVVPLATLGEVARMHGRAVRQLAKTGG
jgi:hypothetical protein